MTVEQKKAETKIKKLYAKYVDEAATADEKTACKSNADRIASRNGLKVDWKTGKVSIDSKASSNDSKASEQKQAANDQTKQQQASSKAGNAADAGSMAYWTTKEIAAILSKMLGKEVTAKTLRRHLRSMDEYNDGKTTNYRWKADVNDAEVKKVIDTFVAKGKKSA